MGNTPSCFYEKVNDDGSVSLISPSSYSSAAAGGLNRNRQGSLLDSQDELNFDTPRPNDSDEDESSLTLSECESNEEVIAIMEKNFYAPCDVVNEQEHHHHRNHHMSISSSVAELDVDYCGEKSAMDSKRENVLSPSYNRCTLSHSPLLPCEKEDVSTQNLVDDLYRAVKNDNIEAIISIATKSVTDCNAVRNMRFPNRLTLLHISVIHARFKIAEYIIENIHIDINAKDNTGRTALDWANLCGNIMMQKLLLSAQMRTSRKSPNNTAETDKVLQNEKESKSTDGIEPEGVCHSLNDDGDIDSKKNISLPLQHLDIGKPEQSYGIGVHKNTAVLTRKIRKAASQALRVLGLKKTKNVARHSVEDT